MSLLTAQQLEDAEQYEKAYEEYKRVYEKKRNKEVLERLAHVALILDKKDEAAQYYNEILELDATDIMAYEQLMDIYESTDRYKYYISRGNIHILQEQFSHAINDFKKALDKAKSDEEINSSRFVLATLYEKAEKNNSAIDEYLRVIESSAANEICYINLANIYIKEDSVSSAIEILERAIENGFSSDELKEILAGYYLKNGQYDKVRETTSDELLKIKSLLQEEKTDEAYKYLENIKDEYKNDSQYHLLMAQFYFNKKDWENSLSEVDEFKKFEKNSPLVYQMRAMIYENKGDEYTAHVNWAKYNISRNNDDIALNEYYEAYKIKDNDAELVSEMAELLEKMEDSTQAGEFWGHLVALEPQNKRALEKYADFKESIGDYRGQIDALENLCEITKNNSVAVKKLAKAYDKTKNRDKALEYYKLFVAHSPINADYKQAKERIEALEKNKNYTQSSNEEEGLLDKIMKLFGK